MKQSLQLKLSQQLTLTPQLQQSIRLLQLSTMELDQEVEMLIQENPLLERVDGDSEESSSTESEIGPIEFQPQNELRYEEQADTEASLRSESPDDEALENPWTNDSVPIIGGQPSDEDDSDYPQQARASTLREHLLWQVQMSQLPERDAQLTALLIDALDEDGYLTQPLEEIAELLPEELELTSEDLEIALKHLQHFDPAGVGARDLAESLSLQLAALPHNAPGRELALSVVGKHLDLLASRDFTKLKRLLNCTDAELRSAQQLITHMNPRPGAAFAPVETRYIVPDVLVRKIRGSWTASLNPDAIPKLRINRLYADILQHHRGSHQQLATQLQEAKWFIKNIQQRFDTILRVSQAIVERQKHFFEHGEVAMRPLVLREIADVVGLHESTISRVTTQKFMHTPRGIFELKYFFGSHVATDTGGACSATAIRALIKQLVGAEDPKHPLSDNQIAELLAKQGIMVARRTIAKYREGLHIPPASQRKSI